MKGLVLNHVNIPAESQDMDIFLDMNIFLNMEFSRILMLNITHSIQ